MPAGQDRRPCHAHLLPRASDTSRGQRTDTIEQSKRSGCVTGDAMSVEPGWVPPRTDTTKANIARVYDWWLGGNHNFRVDQDAARAAVAVDPNTRVTARANRAFLGRVVRFLA